jgi:hypothetical protein
MSSLPNSSHMRAADEEQLTSLSSSAYYSA